MDSRIERLQALFPSSASRIVVIPKFVKLLYGLFRDSRVPRYLKVLTAGSIAYVALPFDFLPDFVPVAGAMDEIAVIFLILIEYMKYCPPEVFVEHWNECMGDDFDIESDLVKTVDELAALVGNRYAGIRNGITAASAKLAGYVNPAAGESGEAPADTGSAE